MLQPDCPDIQRTISHFIARLIIDECLDSDYVSSITLLNPDSELSINTVYDAFSLLKDDCSKNHADVIWNKNFSLEEAKEFFDRIVEKFFKSGNNEEALNKLKTSKWRFFNHEFVRRLCIAAFKMHSSVTYVLLIGQIKFK